MVCNARCSLGLRVRVVTAVLEIFAAPACKDSVDLKRGRGARPRGPYSLRCSSGLAVNYHCLR